MVDMQRGKREAHVRGERSERVEEHHRVASAGQRDGDAHCPGGAPRQCGDRSAREMALATPAPE